MDDQATKATSLQSSEMPSLRTGKQPHSQAGAQPVSSVAQNVAKNVIAQQTGKKRSNSPLPTPSVESVAAAVMVPTATDLEAQERETLWMETLNTTPTGKKLCDYLGHVTSVLDDGPLGIECPIDQAVTFRRVLIRALEKNAKPFGLPKKLPKFIAMVQMCGERLLLTTDLSQLFQLLAHCPSNPRANSDAINAMYTMIKYQEENPECSLLLTYSAPFQVDLSHMWWDVRTLRRSAETLKVTDGEMAYQIGQNKCRPIGCTSVLESDISNATLEREIEAFKQHISAIDLDVELLPMPEPNGSSDEQLEKRVATSERLIAAMKADRVKIIAEHKEEVEALKASIKASNEYMEEAARMQHASDRESDESLNRQINKLAKDVEAHLKECARLSSENESLKAQHKADLTGALLRKDEEVEALRGKVSLLETSGRAAGQELTKCNKARESALRKQSDAHQKSLDEMERKLGKATMAERAAKQEAEELMGKLSTLSSAMEGRDSEKELLQHDLKKALASKRVLKCVVALAGARRETITGEHAALDDVLKKLDDANGRIRISELALGNAAAERQTLLDLTKDQEAARDQMGEANARLQARIDELEVPTPPPVELMTNDVETMTVPITSQADLDLGELQTKHCKIQDELDASRNECVQLKAELGRAKSKAAKKQVPASLMADESTAKASPVLGVPSQQSAGGYNIVTNVHVGNGGAGNSTAVASTDLGHAPDVDAAVEHLIAQAASSLRILADQARECARHKAAAHEGWAQVRALQNYTGYQMPQQQWSQQMQQMHHPHSPNGYH